MDKPTRIQSFLLIASWLGIVLLGGTPDLKTGTVFAMVFFLLLLGGKNQIVFSKCTAGYGLLLLLVSCGQFLPNPLDSVWREELRTAEIPLFSTANAQPLLAVPTFLWLGIVCLWAIFIRHLREYNGGELFSKCLRGGVIFLGAALGAGFWAKQISPFATESHVFSFFPSRNQSAFLLVCAVALLFHTALLCGARKKISSTILSLGVAGFLCATVIYYPPRAGLLLLSLVFIYFFFAQTAWLSLGKKIWTLVMAGIIGVSGLWLSDSSAWQRIVSQNELLGLRWEIYQSTSAMIADHPFGVGWGNFVHVFPQYWDGGWSGNQIIHPESSFLWMVAEGGWALGAGVAAGVIFLLARAWRQQTSSGTALYRFLFVLFLIHSVIDVSAHRPGTALLGISFAVLMLAGEGTRKNIRLPSRLLASAGIVFTILLLGFLALHSPAARERRMETLYKQDLFEVADQLCLETTRLYPLAPESYYFRAQRLLRENDFRASRVMWNQLEILRPQGYGFRWAEINEWIRVDPPHALARLLPLLNADPSPVKDLDIKSIQLFNQAPATNATLGQHLLSNEERFAGFLQFANNESLLAYARKFLIPTKNFDEKITLHRNHLLERLIPLSAKDEALQNWLQADVMPNAPLYLQVEYLLQQDRVSEALALCRERTLPPPAISYQEGTPTSGQVKELLRMQEVIKEEASPIKRKVALQQYLATFPPHPFVQYWYAHTLSELGEEKQACHAWIEYLKNSY